MKNLCNAEVVSPINQNKYKRLQKLLNLWDTDKIQSSMSASYSNDLELEADFHNSGKVMDITTRQSPR